MSSVMRTCGLQGWSQHVPVDPSSCRCPQGCSHTACCRLQGKDGGPDVVRMWFLTARSVLSSGGDGTVAQETTGEQHSLSLHMETFTHTLQAEGRSVIVPDQTPRVKGRKSTGGCRQLGGVSRKQAFRFCLGLQDCTVQDPEKTL